MKYVSIDTETTGLDFTRCQILSFAAVIEDTDSPNVPVKDLPHIHMYVNHKKLEGEPYAMNLNKGIIETLVSIQGTHGLSVKESLLGDGITVVNPDELIKTFQHFLYENGLAGKVNLAGKNLEGFDLKFLRNINQNSWDDSNEWDNTIKARRRIIDPAPLYLDIKVDKELPNLDKCLERAGVEKSVTHDALDDARDVISVLRHKL